jgi:hypothetical protein
MATDAQVSASDLIFMMCSRTVSHNLEPPILTIFPSSTVPVRWSPADRRNATFGPGLSSFIISAIPDIGGQLRARDEQHNKLESLDDRDGLPDGDLVRWRIQKRKLRNILKRCEWGSTV